MLRAAVLAEPGSGSTTVLGLLYAAQVRFGSERGDRFRFFSPPESLACLSRSYQQLVAGELPAAASDAEVVSVRFDLAFRKNPGLLDRFRKGAEFGEDPEVECRWTRKGFRELADSLGGLGSAGPAPMGLMECNVPIFVLAARSPPSSESGPSRPAPTPDDAVCQILQRLQGPNDARTGAALHPIVLFTQLDTIPEATLRAHGATGILDEDRLTVDRPRLAASFLKERLPLTTEFCRKATGDLASPRVFFSYVRVEPATGTSPPRIRTRRTAGHPQEPEYPWAEYRALLEYLGEVAGSTR